jgi:hypothetical protein
MSNDNFGLVAGLTLVASTIAILLEHKIVGAMLGVIGLCFAVALGLSKRAKYKARAKSL